MLNRKTILMALLSSLSALPQLPQSLPQVTRLAADVLPQPMLAGQLHACSCFLTHHLPGLLVCTAVVLQEQLMLAKMSSAWPKWGWRSKSSARISASWAMLTACIGLSALLETSNALTWGHA